jgi:hypothetical protein
VLEYGAGRHQDRALDAFLFENDIIAGVDNEHVALLPQLMQFVCGNAPRAVRR